MRKSRMFLALALVGMLAGACTSPSAPRYPQPDEETGDPGPPPNPSMTLPGR